ncbi:MAG TPA: 2'-5' RNA ligase family protein [Balneolaceae bacterium]|nr:2'-5' RNA ligase family protein [Balneolaceae bacterium]
MAAHQKHALWIRPFGETAFELKQRIRRLSKQYGTPMFEPHITLVSGLYQGETELIQLTDTLAGSLSPFQVELKGLGYRDHYYQCLYFKVKNTNSFLNVQKVAGKFFGYESDEGYFPHLSLMYGNIPEREKRRLISTMDKSEYIRFPIHSLLLIKTEGDVNDWEKIHSAEFKHSYS